MASHPSAVFLVAGALCAIAPSLCSHGGCIRGQLLCLSHGTRSPPAVSHDSHYSRLRQSSFSYTTPERQRQALLQMRVWIPDRGPVSFTKTSVGGDTLLMAPTRSSFTRDSQCSSEDTEQAPGRDLPSAAPGRTHPP